MPIGDVDVLKRIEKQDKKADKACRLLMKKLSRKKRGKRNFSTDPITVRLTSFPSISFSSEAKFAYNEETATALRRIKKCKDDRGKRAFYVGEIGCIDEVPASFIVIPRNKEATIPLACQSALKQEGTVVQVMTNCVCVFESVTEDGILICDEYAQKIVVQKVRMQNGVAFFFAASGTGKLCSQPSCMGLTKSIFKQMQLTLVKLFGAALNAEQR